MDKITVSLNDEPKQVTVGETVATLVESLQLKTAGLAVAVNTEVIPQREWARKTLQANDSILLITATQGG